MIMLMKSRYGTVETPALTASSGGARCPFCPRGSIIPAATTAVQIDINPGPTGRVFICLPHAAQLAQALSEIVNKEWARVVMPKPKKRPRGKVVPRHKESK
jgi:hypothetical protein